MCSHEAKLLIRECFGPVLLFARQGGVRYGSLVERPQVVNRPGKHGGRDRQ
jgi:hypothetical protein